MKSKPQSEAEGIPIRVRIRIRNRSNIRGEPICKLALQVGCCRGLPIELILELTHDTLLRLKLSFELRNLLLLRFYKSVHATGLRVACVVRTFPWYLDGFRYGRKGEEDAG